MSYGDNPKFAQGALKPDYSLIPSVAEKAEIGALHHGAHTKGYGEFNWRDTEIDVRTYYAAIRRHLDAYVNGEEIDPESGIHHLGHVRACTAILMDAEECGVLDHNWGSPHTDDEPPTVPLPNRARPAHTHSAADCSTQPEYPGKPVTVMVNDSKVVRSLPRDFPTTTEGRRPRSIAKGENRLV